jgi:hypothetical protein
MDGSLIASAIKNVFDIERTPKQCRERYLGTARFIGS